ncbi:MAG: HNH endonuclease signature motif containing protein [Pyrinomonadaceae bacterium]
MVEETCYNTGQIKAPAMVEHPEAWSASIVGLRRIDTNMPHPTTILFHAPLQYQLAVAKRFWRKVDKSNGANACWLWLASGHEAGYGQFSIRIPFQRRRMVKAHRLAYELTHGMIPTGHVICHRCDNPPCCNPQHLFSATQKQNTEDKYRKGRQNHAIGTQITSAKLSNNKVITIRRLYVAGGYTQIRLAEMYGVSDATIRRVVKHQNWEHIS